MDHPFDSISSRETFTTDGWSNEDSDDPTQRVEECSQIVMVSLPDTPEEEEKEEAPEEEEEKEETPEEEEEKIDDGTPTEPPVAADDPGVDGNEAVEAVDLGKDSDLGISEQSKKLGLSKILDSEAQLTHQDTEIIEEMALEENKDEEAQLSMEGSTKRKLEFLYGDTVSVDSESEEEDWEEDDENRLF